MRDSGAMASSDPFIGQLVNGRYRVLSVIGRGGMGRIYKAEQIPLGRLVAFKVLSLQEGETDATFERRFFLEASLCARLSHPNVVTIHDYGRVEDGPVDTYFIAMEYIEGITLYELLRSRGGALSVEEASGIALEIARGLRIAHRAGIIHRDLKPGNVMLVGDEDNVTRLKILDFGLVKNVAANSDEREQLTQTGTFVGSPSFMSPEQVRSRESVDQRTDIYSLGVILYKCLTGRAPFEGDPLDVMMAHVQSPVPPFRERSAECAAPAVLEELVLRMLAKDPSARPQTIGDVIRELREIRGGLGLGVESLSLESTAGGPVVELVVEPVAEIAEVAAPDPAAVDPGPSANSPAPLPVVQGAPPRTRTAAAALVALLLIVTGVALWRGRRTASTGATVGPVATSAVGPSGGSPLSATPATDRPPVAARRGEDAPPAAPLDAAREPVPPPIAATGEGGDRRGARSVATRGRAPAAHRASAPALEAGAAEYGFLNLDATPWANVKEGGTLLGATPLLGVRLRAGQHTFTLENPELGRSTTYTVNIAPGQSVSRRLGIE